MRRRTLLIAALLAAAALGAEPDLRLGPQDFFIRQSLEGGYHLWIRQKEGVGSVLLAESTADPDGKLHSYTLRNPVYHPLNGEERRILDGKFLEPNGTTFLMDSTPEEHPSLGRAFHIFVPFVVQYGYPWSRSGEVQILDGSFLNVRTFARPYADYRGAYRDNPFQVRVRQLELAEPPGSFMPATVESFKGIAARGRGEAVLSAGQEDLVDKIGDFLDAASGGSLDLVLALDTTDSMRNDMPALKGRIVPLLAGHTRRFRRFRVGLLYYRDYLEAYLNRPYPFQDNLAAIQRQIDSVQVSGGRDIPEAVFEALYAGIHSYDWQAEARMIILVGDAPPHPRPRGKITAEMVYRDAGQKDVAINTIILPQ